jgi:N-acetylglucosaminyl-diphospho-decaprenol L-rhamnosyltransferase
MKREPDVVIIIVGLDARHFVLQCLRSLATTEWSGILHQTVYVDNGSRDGTVDEVRSAFPDVTVIANSNNVGFCRACNQAARPTQSRYIFYLNDDTIVFSDTVPRLVRFLDENVEAVAAGCRLLYPDLSEQWSARRYPSWRNAIFGRRSLATKFFPRARVVREYLYKDQMEGTQPFAVDWIPGSCTLIRRQASERVGGLPEDLHYWSDTVFCDRVRRTAPGRFYVVPESKLIHFEGHGSGDKSIKKANWLIRDFHRGAYVFYCEHYGLGPMHPARWFAAVGLALRAGFLMLRKSFRRVVKPD